VRRVFALLFVSSCLFPDLGSLSSGDAGGSDATTDVVTDVTNDVTLDAPPSDAGLDVKKSPCTQSHTFCDDFDDGSLGATWDKIDNAGGTLAQSTNAASPPYAFEARVPAGGHPSVVLEKYLPAANHVHYECDMIILGAQDAGSMEVDYFDFSFAPTGYSYGDFNMERLDLAGDIEQISQPNGADASAYQDDPISETFPAWKHLVIDIDFTKATFAATVDGVTIDTMTMKPPFTSSSSTLSVGVTYSGGLQTQWSVLVDNVVIDLQ
jgi:hypothetical protein